MTENTTNSKDETEQLKALSKRRRELVKSLKVNGSATGLKDLLSGMYATHGHFIYELLQNAEDAKANKVIFNLTKDSLIFSHNGTKLFSVQDIESITNIGNSTKKLEGNSIGKFGVGFKSVYEYTAKPDIKSGKYHFRIEDMLYPNVFENKKYFKDTVITLPLGTEKHSINECIEDIQAAFNSLPYDTLLFLKNIKTIQCKIKDYNLYINRIEEKIDDSCSICHLTIRDGDKPQRGKRFLRFFNTIKVNDNNNTKNIDIAIAYSIVPDKEKKYILQPILNSDDKPAGKVYTFFNCPNEISNLCFHIHAPFELPPTREALKDSKTNKYVISKLVDLFKKSILYFRDNNHLDINILSLLPICYDNIPSKYYDFSNSVREMFNLLDLTPMTNGKLCGAKNRFLDVENLSKTFDDNFLNIINHTKNKSNWIKFNYENSERAQLFISSLDSSDFNIDDIMEILSNLNQEEELKLKDYLLQKDIPWFQDFYAAIAESNNYPKLLFFSMHFPYCLCENHELVSAVACRIKNSDNIPLIIDIKFIEPKLFECISSRKSMLINKCLRNNFFISDYDLKTIICLTIEKYERNEERTIKDLLEIFNFFIEARSDFPKLGEYSIPLLDDEGNYQDSTNLYFGNKYGIPILNLDVYYEYVYNPNIKELETYSRKKHLSPKYKLSDDYLKYIKEDELSDFKSFLTYMEVTDKIEISEQSCSRNDNWKKIKNESESTYGNNCRQTNIDYNILGLDKLLKTQNEKIFYLLFTLLSNTSVNLTDYTNNVSFTKCRFKWAQKFREITYPSQLINNLTKNAWVLQVENGNKKFVTPGEAQFDLLPTVVRNTVYKGHNFEKWMTAMDFGSVNAKQRLEQEKENKLLQSLGLDPDLTRKLKDAQDKIPEETYIKFTEQLKKNLESILQIYNNDNTDEFDSERLQQKAKEELENSSNIDYVKTSRSIRLNQAASTTEAKNYLISKYNSQEIFTCQLCHCEMPFKKPDNSYYFEVTQLFNSKIFNKDLPFSRVALCPTCSAKMKVWFTEEKQIKLYKEIIKSDLSTYNFTIQLDKPMILHFVKEHIMTLRELLKENDKQNNQNS